MARRGGILGRITRAIRQVTKTIADAIRPPEPPRREPPPPPPPPPEPPRRRTQDPYLRWWDYELRGQSRTGYLNHKDIIDDMGLEYDLSEEDKQELWRDYLHYMVSRRSHFRRNDIRNPFWQKWGIDPDNFDWWAWRDAMGYSHGNRRA